MSERETRQYQITATTEQLDILETLFNTMRSMGKAGASRTIQLYVDGDGAFRPEIKKIQEEEEIPLNALTEDTTKDTITHGYGIIKKNTEELHGDGYYIYYDFG